MTHPPEPLTNEYSHALSWEAATQRLEAAGSIPVEEAELRTKALSSNDAGFEVRFRPSTVQHIHDSVCSIHCTLLHLHSVRLRYLL